MSWSDPRLEFAEKTDFGPETPLTANRSNVRRCGLLRMAPWTALLVPTCAVQLAPYPVTRATNCKGMHRELAEKTPSGLVTMLFVSLHPALLFSTWELM